MKLFLYLIVHVVENSDAGFKATESGWISGNISALLVTKDTILISSEGNWSKRIAVMLQSMKIPLHHGSQKAFQLLASIKIKCKRKSLPIV